MSIRDIHRNPIIIVINHSFIEIILQIYDPFYLKLTLFYQPPFLHIYISTIVREAFKTLYEKKDSHVLRLGGGDQLLLFYLA